MIVARMTDGTLFIGLSARNIDLLKQEHPIDKSGLEGIPRLVIVYGETEQTIFESLKKAGLVRDETRLHGVPDL